VTRSVGIPDAAVKEALAVWMGTDVDSFHDAMRAALVAARPYLMPTREQIAKAMHDHWSQTHTWRQGCSEGTCIAIFLDRAGAVLALLDGTEP